VIKESYGSFGEQVYLAHTIEEAQATVAAIGAKPFLFQKFISSSFGRDVRVNVVGGSAVCAMERVGRAGDFRSNIAGGGVGSGYTLSPDEEALAVRAAAAVGADFAGVDLLFGEGGMLVCEVNSNPHFTGTYKHTGINLAVPILEHILKTV
jgi:ribosomal protein S6--L-glutamate ligase/gamma-F420-2:alpha-L-glutamate ligase